MQWVEGGTEECAVTFPIQSVGGWATCSWEEGRKPGLETCIKHQSSGVGWLGANEELGAKGDCLKNGRRMTQLCSSITCPKPIW